MKYEWWMVHDDGKWVNHVLPKYGKLTSICGIYFGAANGDDPSKPYCEKCKELLPKLEHIEADKKNKAEILRDQEEFDRSG